MATVRWFGTRGFPYEMHEYLDNNKVVLNICHLLFYLKNKGKIVTVKTYHCRELYVLWYYAERARQ
jgi:hypothetical protein